MTSKLALDVTVAHDAFELVVEHDITLDGITAVYGPSASGKTTLLRVIAGLEERARGRVEFDGAVWQRDGRRLPAHARGVGYVFQDGRLFGHLTVEGNLRFAIRHAARRATPKSPIELSAVVRELDLAPLLPRRPASLSAGEQQRVAIGRALLTSPRLLLMDEPLSSLDIGRKREIVPLLERLPEVFGVPVLYVTHNVDEVARLASNMLLLKAGRIVASGRVEDVLERLDLDDLTGGRDTGAVLHVRVEAGRRGGAALRLTEQRLHVPVARAARRASVADPNPRARRRARDRAAARTQHPERVGSADPAYRRGRADQRRRAARSRRPTLAIADHARRARGARARAGPARVRVDQERRAREHDAVLSG